MKVKINGARVDVLDKGCAKRRCLWVRTDPGVFSQGRGYTRRAGNVGLVCGHREIRGCPSDDERKRMDEEGE